MTRMVVSVSNWYALVVPWNEMESFMTGCETS